MDRFNTASGKYCCNESIGYLQEKKNQESVSIPQAVSTVATALRLGLLSPKSHVSIPQAVSTVATLEEQNQINDITVYVFQYRKR